MLSVTWEESINPEIGALMKGLTRHGDILSVLTFLLLLTPVRLVSEGGGGYPFGLRALMPLN